MGMYNIFDVNMGRSAYNAPARVVADIVRPWFVDFADDAKVREAVNGLANPHTRGASAEYLGLELVPVA